MAKRNRAADAPVPAGSGQSVDLQGSAADLPPSSGIGGDAVQEWFDPTPERDGVSHGATGSTAEVSPGQDVDDVLALLDGLRERGLLERVREVSHGATRLVIDAPPVPPPDTKGISIEDDQYGAS